jgi:lipopolysaccharide biosynthesis regulator YciM
MTAVEWLEEKLSMYVGGEAWNDVIYVAKEMEKNEKLKYQLFIGKVSCEIGFDKTNQLLKEVNETFKLK